MSVALERDKIVHDMANMVQVIHLAIMALAARPPPAARDEIIGECKGALARLRADFERFTALCRVP